MYTHSHTKKYTDTHYLKCLNLQDPVETPLDGILPDESPTVKRPSPLAIRILEKFLHDNKMRLVDLFRRVDKDKDWKLSREEFRSAVTTVNMIRIYKCDL